MSRPMKGYTIKDVFGCTLSVTCVCGYTAPTEYVPNKSQPCPECGKSMPKPRLKVIREATLDG